MSDSLSIRTRAQESRRAIEWLYIIMRHLFIRGSYKPLGVSGRSIMKSLLLLKPEIYGSMGDEEKVELNGLAYVMDRLPKGIEECRQINLISREGFEQSKFEVILPAKRRRNCYRIDDEQMFIELTRGRSDIYDILTHLTFLFIESEKIKNNARDQKGRIKLAWNKLEDFVWNENVTPEELEKSYAYLSTLIGRTYAVTKEACKRFDEVSTRNSLFFTIYWLGRIAMEEEQKGKNREITFSSTLRHRIGHHEYGELWANKLKQHLISKNMFHRPLHIISANLHSVMNVLYARGAMKKQLKNDDAEGIYQKLGHPNQGKLRKRVKDFALQHGMDEIEDTSGTNITVQIMDTSKIMPGFCDLELNEFCKIDLQERPVLLVMDYAFGEQAYETMDELLKPYHTEKERLPANVASISIMGKAGILGGDKGDIMIPNAHVFEGTADNYPFENELKPSDFNGKGPAVYSGPMITVLGTSLQNKDVLEYFQKSSWKTIGLEMEGAHYQKAIQAASRIRGNIDSSVTLRYAYYASDNPLKTGKTLASGSLGSEGIRPAYLITLEILKKIFKTHKFTS